MEYKTRIIERAKKILELVNRGVDGERENAEKLLEKILTRNGLVLADILEDETKYRRFKVYDKEEAFLFRHSVGVTNPGIKVSYDGDKMHRRINCTDYEFVQISELFKFHRKNYFIERKKILTNFDAAYYNKHNLFFNDGKKDDQPHTPNPDIDWHLIERVMGSMTESFHKAIKQ